MRGFPKNFQFLQIFIIFKAFLVVGIIAFAKYTYLFIVLLLLLLEKMQAPALVETKIGKVEGHFVKSAENILVEEYLGLPYGTAQRFTDSKPLHCLPKGNVTHYKNFTHNVHFSL